MLLEPSAAFEYTSEVIVEHSYCGPYQELLEQPKRGLALDLGSGNNPDVVPALIKLDIFAVPNVDVVAVAEAVPFKKFIRSDLLRRCI